MNPLLALFFSVVACWVIFHALVVIYWLFQKVIRVSNGLDPDQDQHYVHPHLGSNSLQRLAADKKFTLDLKLHSVILYTNVYLNKLSRSVGHKTS